jgi:hypothetical protein
MKCFNQSGKQAEDTVTIRVAAPQPGDIVINNLRSDPQALNAGEEFTVLYEVKNQGQEVVWLQSVNNDRVTDSTGADISAILISDTDCLLNLDENQSCNVTLRLRINQPGTYTLTARIRTLGELNTQNNTKSLTITVQGSAVSFIHELKAGQNLIALYGGEPTPALNSHPSDF